MNDDLFQQWSDTLAEIRQARMGSLTNLQKEKSRNFSPKDFVDVAKVSLDDALSRWWSFEQESLKSGASPEDQESLPSEMESVVDFELESIGRDLEPFQKQSSWKPKAVTEEMEHLESFAAQLKRTYQQKISLKSGGVTPSLSDFEPSLVPMTDPDPLPELAPLPSPVPVASVSPQPAVRPQRRSPSSGGSGVAMFLMFVVGLLIGSGPSIYFWDQLNKVGVSTQEQVTQIQSEKRALEDNVAVFKRNYSDLAQGKIKTIPQLEDMMQPIRAEIATRKRKIEKDYTEKREGLIRKIPAGDRLDRSIEKLKENRDGNLEALEAESKTRLEPYLKQMQLLKELIEN